MTGALAALAVLLSAPGAAPSAASASPEVPGRETVILTTPSGDRVVIDAEVADDPDEIDRGLAGRGPLEPGEGMLFVMPDEPVAFWMRGVTAPLDLLFIDRRGVLRRVAPNAKPFDETLIPGADPGDPDPGRPFALEIGAGEAARLGLVPGTVMRLGPAP